MNPIVQRLSEGEHPVIVILRPYETATTLKERINLGYVHIKFVGTRGGTELSVHLKRDACDFTQADFDHQNGRVHLVGELVLNFVRVQCIADIDLATLKGKGYLNPLAKLSPADTLAK